MELSVYDFHLDRISEAVVPIFFCYYGFYIITTTTLIELLTMLLLVLIYILLSHEVYFDIQLLL